MSRSSKLALTAAFLVLVFVLVPCADRGHAARSDLYYTLTSVALAEHRQRRRVADLLHRPHQYRAGRLRADRRLCLGDPGRPIRRLVLADACRSRGCFCAAASVSDRSADPAVAGRLFRHGDARADRGRAAPGARRADHQRRQGDGEHSLARARCACSASRSFPISRTLANPRQAFYFVSVALMVLCFAGLYRLVHSRIGKLCQSLQQNEELASSIGVDIAYLRVIAYAISSFLGGVGGRHVRADLAIDLPLELHGHRFRQLHAELLPRRARLRVRADRSAPSSCISAGTSSSRRQQFQLLIFSTVLIALMLVLPNGLLSLSTVARRQGAENGRSAHAYPA